MDSLGLSIGLFEPSVVGRFAFGKRADNPRASPLTQN
jgi:hypothetical protein